MPIDPVYYCKDCKHSRMGIADKIFTLGGLIGVSDVNYKCAKLPENAQVVEDMVLGPKKVKAKLPFCEIARNYRGCGIEAKFWQPKHKKDLFKMLTKDHND